MKIIRISDNLHTKLKNHADIDRRTINGEAELILEMYFADAEGGLSSEQVSKDRMREAMDVREHIVNEGVELGILPFAPGPDEIEIEPPKRTTSDILDEINNVKLERDEELAICQDSSARGKISKEYAAKLDELWREYDVLNPWANKKGPN